MKYILSFDVESNGLHGDFFALGGVVMDKNGIIHASFAGQTKVPEPTNSWVVENVLPKISKLPYFSSQKELRFAFWNWYELYNKDSFIFVNTGYPVEARFLLSSYDEDPKKRMEIQPYPLYDLATLLLVSGFDPKLSSEETVAEEIRGRIIEKHNPLWDSEIGALCVLKVLRNLEKIHLLE